MTQAAHTLSDHAQRFRQAMAQLAGAVTVITTDGAHGPAGVTATAVSSVTDSPPTLLVCVHRAGRAHAAIVGNGVLAVNVLASDDELVARHFAGMTDLEMSERFAPGGWLLGAGAPRLPTALAHLAGPVVHSVECGSHSVFFCELTRVDVLHDGDALVYFARRFRSVPRHDPGDVAQAWTPDYFPAADRWV